MAQVKNAPTMDYRVRSKILIHFVLILGSVIMIFPFVWMMLTSVKGLGESMLIPPTFLPRVWRFDNYTCLLYTSFPSPTPRKRRSPSLSGTPTRNPACAPSPTRMKRRIPA